MAALKRVAAWQRLLGLRRLGVRAVSSGGQTSSSDAMHVYPSPTLRRLEREEVGTEEYLKDPRRLTTLKDKTSSCRR